MGGGRGKFQQGVEGGPCGIGRFCGANWCFIFETWWLGVPS